MKRLIMVILAIVILSGLIFVGCSTTPSPTTAPPATSAAPKTTAAPTTSSAPTSSAPLTTAPPTTSPAAAGKTWNLKYAHEQAPNAYYSTQGHIPYQQAVEKATNGKVKITLYDSSSLMKSSQAWDGVKAGTADMAWLFTGYYPGVFSKAEASTLPFMFPSAEIGSKVTWNIYNKYPEIQAVFKDVKVLATWTTEPYFIISRSKNYKTIADWDGQKIRAPGGPPTDFVKAMGASPMLVGMPDCYLNLQKGVFDAMPAPAEAYLGYKIYEVAPYVTNISTVAMYHALIMNLNTWNSMPKDVQDQIMSVSGEKASIQFGMGAFDYARRDMKDTITKAGTKLQEYTVPADEQQKWIDKAGKPVWDAWVKTQTAAGLNNAQAILNDTIALSKQFSAAK